MSLTPKRFDEFFRALYKDKNGDPIGPFPWQSRLAQDLANNRWPDCIDLPTASGKTSVIDIAVYTLACQATLEPKDRTIGRRISFAVNRRVIVDEAFDRAKKLAERLRDARDGILKEVADALRSIGGDKALPLQVAQLRGGVFRDRAWAQSIVQPIVVCTTADQLGSRLLFRGYGVSDSMKPVHAALCACDSVILLDEAHVTKAFAQTLRLIERYQQHRPGIRFVEMTATPSVEPKSRLALSEDDLAHPVLKCRQLAHKPAALVKVNAKALVTEIVKQAIGAVNDDERKAVGIIVNRVQTARDVYAKLREFHPDATHLVIGRMRPIDRDDLQTQLRNIVGPSRPEVLPADHKPVFVVATQCLEVGADYDFDALITECASLDALRQRFGRLNRRGREYADKSPFETVAFILATDDSLKGGDPIYEDAIKHTWEWLQSKKDAGDQVNFGIAAFKPLWDAADDDTRKLLLSPSRDAAVLLPAHLDALCQTSPQPIPSPDVSYFIHGSRRDMAEVNVCWRADLGDDRTEWPDAVRLLPPTSPECMTVPLVAVRKWMGETLRAMPEADVPTLPPEVEERRNASEPSASQWVLRWRGSKQVETTSDPRDIAPGDTVVLPATYCNWNELGHIPGAPSANELARQKDEDDRAYEQRRRSLLSKVDLAERATRESRLRLVLRLHDHFPDRRDLRGLPTAELRAKLTSLLDAELDGRPERDTVLAALDSRFDRHLYREPDADAPDVKLDEVLVFRRPLDPPNRLDPPATDEDEGGDDLTQGFAFRSLDEHTHDVVQALAAALEHLNLGELQPPVEKAAPLHDLGKADLRFQAMLAGITPYEAIERPTLLAKGDGKRRTQAEARRIAERSLYPRGFRHEMLSVELLENVPALKVPESFPHRDLLLHLIAAHHGHARPFAPVCIDEADDDQLLEVSVDGITLDAATRKKLVPAHRLDSGVAERFWRLTRAHGWWGLAYLESILRLADQQASAAEQERGDAQTKETNHE